MRKQNAADFRLILDTIFAQPRTAHYETVIKSFEIFIHVMKQHIILEAYFSRFGPITDFRFSKCKGGPDELGKFSYLGQIDLKIALK